MLHKREKVSQTKHGSRTPQGELSDATHFHLLDSNTNINKGEVPRLLRIGTDQISQVPLKSSICDSITNKERNLCPLPQIKLHIAEL